MHELTEKLKGLIMSPNLADEIIRTDMSYRANELYEKGWAFKGAIDSILGLSPSSEVGEHKCGWDGEGPCPKCPKLHYAKPKDSSVDEPGKHNHATQLCYEGCGWNGESYKDDHKPKDSEVWCEHIVEEGGLLFVVHVGQKVGFPFWYNNCPICGKRRPRREPVKTLQEKIDEFLRSPDRENDFHGKGYLIEKMAREHFKQV